MVFWDRMDPEVVGRCSRTVSERVESYPTRAAEERYAVNRVVGRAYYYGSS